MAYVRGHDDRDSVKDFHDKARRIIADGKEVPRLRQYNKSGIAAQQPFQMPTGMGLSPQDSVLYGKRQEQMRVAKSDFYNTPVLPEPDRCSTIFSKGNRLLF
tara:strand:+ start:11449 stop:11754 length:306 start_codon:yes stop_codon:yes gene_type:complete